MSYFNLFKPKKTYKKNWEKNQVIFSEYLFYEATKINVFSIFNLTLNPRTSSLIYFESVESVEEETSDDEGGVSSAGIKISEVLLIEPEKGVEWMAICR